MRFATPTLALLVAASPLAFAHLAGCASTSRPAPTVDRLKADLGWSAQESAQFAAFVHDFVERSEVAADEKPMLLARAAMLEQHATVLLAHLARDEGPSLAMRDIETKDLTARIAAIRGERASLEFEWNVWQVANGVKRAEETDLHLVMPPGDC